MVSVWVQLADRAEQNVGPSATHRKKALASGQAAYARRTANEVWGGLARRMELRLKGLGIPELRTCPDDMTLPDGIRAWRLKELAEYFPEYM
jgi:hypothetical protein